MKSEIDRARLYAYKLIDYRPRSEREIKRRLEQKGYSREIINTVTELLVRLGYIEDKAFARYWVACKAGVKGCYGLRRDLLNKGIDTAVIDETIAELGPEAEYNSALKLASSKIKVSGGTCPYPRLAGFLNRRGFSYGVINRVCAELGYSEA